MVSTGRGESGYARPIDVNFLTEQAQRASVLAVHPVFIALVREIQSAPKSERLATAERLANINALRERGLPMPEEFRLTTRYFENSNAIVGGSIRLDTAYPVVRDEPVFTMTVCISIGEGPGGLGPTISLGWQI